MGERVPGLTPWANFFRASGAELLGEPVEDFVVGAGQGEGPGVAAAETEGRAGKRDAREGIVVGIAADNVG